MALQVGYGELLFEWEFKTPILTHRSSLLTVIPNFTLA